MADKKDIHKHGGFIEMKDVANNDGFEVYIEKNSLDSYGSNKDLIIDGEEMDRFGQKVARLTLIKK
ncbi:MAG: hypothetical protein GF311_22365 [Candidatus Lokiarchaeota archaeon]|nr:hypothetical protein [Candidatus Lokiarchaeota archaeon]